MFQVRRAHIGFLLIVPLFIVALCLFGPIQTDTIYTMSGFGYDIRAGAVPGTPTIDPNIGVTSYALGKRAVLEILQGRWPLWNHYEGLGTPLLGEMQSAALFPPNLLLLLPHGQEIEQALLQFIGGLGAYFFFRRFGLGPLAAVTGGLLYELNGVYAWLRNGVFNPVAFLPWLFLCVEALRAHAAAGEGFLRRLPAIAGGALAGALALYAGFPEVAYLYALLLVMWTVFRFVGLAPDAWRRLSVDLGLTGIVGLSLSAPVLLAFAYFLPDGVTGQHDAGFGEWTIHPAAMIQYLAPYIYGLIFAFPYPPTWGNIGGYTGFVPVVAAAAAFAVPGLRGVKLVLLAWIVIAVGASQDMPVVHDAFMLLPMTKLAACYRYLNTGWIFAVIFLAALFIDRVPALPPAVLRRTAWIGLGAGLIIAAGCVAAGWPIAREMWSLPQYRVFWERGFGALLMFGLAFAAAGYLRRPGVALAAVAVTEAALWYFLPFLSHPKAARLDAGAIAFLQENVGYARVTGAVGHGIGPNYGSAYGIPTLNYNDLPVPKPTVDYLARTLDPSAGLAFMWSEARETDRVAEFRARLPAYARTGVKYVLADAAFNARVTAPRDAPTTPHYLVPGQILEAAVPSADATLAGLTLFISGRERNATGVLKVTACALERCQSAVAEIANSQNGQPQLFAFPEVLPTSVGEAVTVLIERVGGEGRTGVAVRGAAPVFGTMARKDQIPVHAGPSMAIFEIPGTRPYFSAPGCTLQTLSWDRATADCPAPATLTRLEVALRGWSATVNGVGVEIGQEDATFQTAPLPAGRSEIAFHYWPPHFGATIGAAAAALLVLLVGLIFALRPHSR